MSFFAVLFALILEQARPLPRDNVVHESMVAWSRFAGRNFDAGQQRHAWLVWLVTVAVPALAAWLAYALFASLNVLAALAWNVAILYVTLGFRQFSYQFTDIREALDRGDEEGPARGSRSGATSMPASCLAPNCCVTSSSIRCLRRTGTSSASSSGSSRCLQSASARRGPCSIAWPSSHGATGPTRSAPATSRPMSG